jgi:hypothetical protein
VHSPGVEVSANSCPPISVWSYKSVPFEASGTKELLSTTLKPGEAIKIDPVKPGNFWLTFGINAPALFPPDNYLACQGPPYVTNSPQISLRILPNNIDFSKYYVDPTATGDNLVCNDTLTFDNVYQASLRTYSLLYPAMDAVFDLSDSATVTKNAPAILYVTDPANWMSSSYMPRTRDLSESRRDLLRAWCREVQPAGAPAARPARGSK